jgi:isopentenyl diphosphate isomerase/L-lactate dehydrogenase-like FMN-dependent dehydrogenase
VLECVLQRGGDAAGVAPGDVEVRSRRVGSVHCEKNKEEGSERCASAREGEGDRNRAAGDLVVVGIERKRPQIRRAPTRNFSVLAASRAGGRTGDGGGVMGPFIGVVRRRNGKG